MIVIITGASRGIGKALAREFAGEGNILLLNARNEPALKVSAEEIKQAGGKVEYLAADLAVSEEVKRFAKWCLSFGTPGILINNAGSFVPGNVSDEATGNLDIMLRANLISAYELTRAVLPSMLVRNEGHIFFMNSIAGLKAYEGGGSYSIAKHALRGFSANLRAELMPTGIKVTSVFPGAVFTDSWSGFDNSNGRIMEADDIAQMIKACSKLSKQATVEEIVIRPQAGDL